VSFDLLVLCEKILSLNILFICGSAWLYSVYPILYGKFYKKITRSQYGSNLSYTQVELLVISVSSEVLELFYMRIYFDLVIHLMRATKAQAISGHW